VGLKSLSPGSSLGMGNPRAENWRDPAGTNPITGQAWRVCDMVGQLEALLGRVHSQAGAQRWQNLWNRLTKEQRGQYVQARGNRPRHRS
jgi:hypothetical protein